MFEQFSPKEIEIMEFVCKGKRNKEIAIATGTTEAVVKNALRVIYDTAGMWSRLELALWYTHHKRLP